MFVIKLFIKLVFDFFGLCICLSLGFIGVSLLLGGIINIRDSSIMEQTSISEIKHLKPTQIVKLKVKTDPERTVKTNFSKLPCHFYIEEKIKVIMDEGTPVLRTTKTNYTPDNLKITHNNHSYFVDIKDSEAMFFIQTEKYYLYNQITKTYNATNKKYFDSNDKLIREKIILPSEEVIIFGKIKDIKIPGKNKIPTIQFEKQNYGNFFENPFNTFNILINTIKNNTFTLFIIYTGNDDKVKEKINSSTAYIMLFLGLFFLIIPSVIIFSIISHNINILYGVYR